MGRGCSSDLDPGESRCCGDHESAERSRLRTAYSWDRSPLPDTGWAPGSTSQQPAKVRHLGVKAV